MLPFFHSQNKNIGGEESRPYAIFHLELCIFCGTCYDQCPSGVLPTGPDYVFGNTDDCTQCGACFDICPAEAIKVEYE